VGQAGRQWKVVLTTVPLLSPFVVDSTRWALGTSFPRRGGLKETQGTRKIPNLALTVFPWAPVVFHKLSVARFLRAAVVVFDVKFSSGVLLRFFGPLLRSARGHLLTHAVGVRGRGLYLEFPYLLFVALRTIPRPCPTILEVGHVGMLVAALVVLWHAVSPLADVGLAAFPRIKFYALVARVFDVRIRARVPHF